MRPRNSQYIALFGTSATQCSAAAAAPAKSRPSARAPTRPYHALWLPSQAWIAASNSWIATSYCFLAYAALPAFKCAIDAPALSGATELIGAGIGGTGGSVTSGIATGVVRAGTRGNSIASYTSKPSELRSGCGDPSASVPVTPAYAPTASRGTAGHFASCSAGNRCFSILNGGRGTPTTHSASAGAVLRASPR